MKVSEGRVGKSISVILIIFGVFILFNADASHLVITGILLIALGIWGLVR